MAKLEQQITEEGPRNAIVKLTGYLDAGDVTEIPAIALTDFTNNDPNLNLTGFRVNRIEWTISDGTEVFLVWESLDPQQIANLAGRGCIDGTRYGGFTPDSTRNGYTGNINLVTTDADPTEINNFTVVLELVKLYSR